MDEKKEAWLGGHVLTWFFSVLSACAVGWAWVYTHPTPVFVGVNINDLVLEERNTLAKIVEAGSESERNDALKRANAFGNKLNAVLKDYSEQCNCVIVNSAAIIAQPSHVQVRDATEQIRQALRASR